MGIGALAQGAEFGKRARAEALSEALDHEATGRKQQREHPFVFGFLARQLSRLESKAEKLAPIAAILIVCEFFIFIFAISSRDKSSEDFEKFLQENILVPLAIGLGVVIVGLILAALILKRRDRALNQRDWALDGFVWSVERDAWLSGTIRAEIEPTASSDITSVRSIVPHATLPLQSLHSRALELIITLDSPWDSGYLMRIGMREHGGADLPQRPGDLYILTESSLLRFSSGTIPESLRRFGELVRSSAERAGLVSIPLSVTLNVLSPEGNPNSMRHGQRMAFGAVGVAAGQAVERSKENSREADMRELIYSATSDNLKAIAESFGWTLLVTSAVVPLARATHD
jgi:hypothetical protein